MYNSGRNFDALSFRIKADTILKNETIELKFGDNSVCYTPAQFNYTRESKHDHLIVVHFNSLNYFGDTIEAFYPTNPVALEALFKEIYENWNKKEIDYKHTCSAILNKIFAELYRQAYNEIPNPSKIKKSAEYIAENYMKPDINIKMLAQKSNMSEVYFRKLFKEEFGVSPKKYIISSRIHLAKNLIESGYYTLSEVAEKCGFSDYKYFSTEFKKITGSSPSDYSYNFKI